MSVIFEKSRPFFSRFISKFNIALKIKEEIRCRMSNTWAKFSDSLSSMSFNLSHRIKQKNLFEFYLFIKKNLTSRSSQEFVQQAVIRSRFISIFNKHYITLQLVLFCLDFHRYSHSNSHSPFLVDFQFEFLFSVEFLPLNQPTGEFSLNEPNEQINFDWYTWNVEDHSSIYEVASRTIEGLVDRRMELVYFLFCPPVSTQEVEL